MDDILGIVAREEDEEDVMTPDLEVNNMVANNGKENHS